MVPSVLPPLNHLVIATKHKDRKYRDWLIHWSFFVLLCIDWGSFCYKEQYFPQGSSRNLWGGIAQKPRDRTPSTAKPDGQDFGAGCWRATRKRDSCICSACSLPTDFFSLLVIAAFFVTSTLQVHRRLPQPDSAWLSWPINWLLTSMSFKFNSWEREIP